MKLREDQINIYTTGVRKANITQHREIAGVKNRVYFVHDFDLLKDIKNEVVREIFFKEVKADVMFLVDSSASIGNENFLKIKNFVRELVNRTDVSADRVQIGVVQFSHKPKEEFQLNTYSTKRDILSAIDRISSLQSPTLTGEALKFMLKYFQAKCRRVERLDIVFVMDSSGSISSSQYQAMKDFMIALVKQSDVSPDGVQFGALKYSDKPVVLFYLNKYATKLEITEAVQRDGLLGQTTYTAKALVHSETFFTEEHGSHKSKGVPQVLIVITDGKSYDEAILDDGAQRLRNKGIAIYAAGVEGANRNELLTMAGSEEKCFYVDTFEGLENLTANITNNICDISVPAILQRIPCSEEQASGKKSYSGVQGSQGPNGVKGNLGYLGDEGELGPGGPPGPQGRQGNMECPGKRGLKGDNGEDGSDGIRGEEGSPGVPGKKGEKGDIGYPGSPGPRGSPGDRGQKDFRGDPGNDGQPGQYGLQGKQVYKGPQGQKGINGQKGQKGRQGHKGPPNEPGAVGLAGTHGAPGKTGIKGENGAFGYGLPGEKGVKGNKGFPGDFGRKGEAGDKGIAGERGLKGVEAECLLGCGDDLNHYCMYDPDFHSLKRKLKCPVYPTERVFALDTSMTPTPETFELMREIIIAIVSDARIRDSNCPVGARVAVVSYNSVTHHLIHFSEFHKKNKLLNTLKNISYQRSSSERDTGGVMRFIAKNVFKRTLQGPTVRKIAVVFSHGPAADASSVKQAVLEMSAVEVVPVVIAFENTPHISQAFLVDDSGLFQVLNVHGGQYNEALQRFQLCTLCYESYLILHSFADKYKPDAFCERPSPRLPRAYVDAAFILESSQKMSGAEFEQVKDFMSKAVTACNISSDPKTSVVGNRIAVVSHALSDVKAGIGKRPVKKEFDFVTYRSKDQMRRYIKESLQQLNGEAAVGYALQWTIASIFSGAPNPRPLKVIIMISAGKTSQWDKGTLKKISLQAKCQGYALLAISLGKFYDRNELEELTSTPLELHLVQLGRIHKPELDCVMRFLKPFVHFLRSKLSRHRCFETEEMSADHVSIEATSFTPPLYSRALLQADRKYTPLRTRVFTKKKQN
ncbi:LOW QUALITY PROTEIN: collagen alpha-6(VI) chain-like [Calonectris borealis]|uniref:LOW QUALITY PROTEIN: collagen alpha-6(VI) chain-like n=1 Tax=Calonectris borealis TaxID=1323832 RepID=UPI003F4C5E24